MTLVFWDETANKQPKKVELQQTMVTDAEISVVFVSGTKKYIVGCKTGIIFMNKY